MIFSKFYKSESTKLLMLKGFYDSGAHRNKDTNVTHYSETLSTQGFQRHSTIE